MVRTRSRYRIVALFIVAFMVFSAIEALADCTLTHTGRVPLSDLAGSYRGFAGGLYRNGQSLRPPTHESVGLRIAREQVRPLDGNGAPDPVNGRIVLVSLGMSNTAREFDGFLDSVAPDPMVNPRVVLVNGARGGMTADQWQQLDSEAWQWMFAQIAEKGVTREQVQVMWVKVVLPGTGSNSPDPTDNFPSFQQTLKSQLETIARNLKTNFPNVKIAYFSSRIRSYVSDTGLSPEPTAYESAFAVRWAIDDQIQESPDLSLTVAPWMSWGPYLWADGLTPRSDGLTYACADLDPDFVHPVAGAISKVVSQLRTFLATDPTATPWFLKPATSPPAIASMTASPATGAAGVRVQFSASANDSDGVREYLWNFGDGTSATGPSPQKVFNVSGHYPIRLTVVDRLGNASMRIMAMPIGSSTGVLPAPPNHLRIVRTD
jgi:hypothetical protein